MEVQYRLSSAIPFGALTKSTFKPHAPNIGDTFCCSGKAQIPILRFGIRSYETEETIPEVWQDGEAGEEDVTLPPGTPPKNPNVEYIARQRHIATQQPPDDVRALIEEHEAFIPPAGDFFQTTKQIGNINKEESFNRWKRIRAFYYLIALQEIRHPVASGSQQVDRFADTLLAIENLSTLKVAKIGANDIPEGKKFIEDPKVMHVRLKQGGIHQLKKPFRKLFFNEVKDDGRQTPYGSNPNIFPHRKNGVFVMPSTCEFSFIDQDGRIMVIRVQEEPEGRLKPYEQSYGTDSNRKHAKEALDDALQNGKIIFSVPKNETDLQGKSQHGIFIDPDWQLPPVISSAVSA